MQLLTNRFLLAEKIVRFPRIGREVIQLWLRRLNELVSLRFDGSQLAPVEVQPWQECLGINIRRFLLAGRKHRDQAMPLHLLRRIHIQFLQYGGHQVGETYKIGNHAMPARSR